ncbi:MAG TPA: discoidin domain-containing protein [Vicinamibacterales bacterium]|nr:discoidin domain-containing protein [Vicinamibacterales bacterium]
MPAGRTLSTTRATLLASAAYLLLTIALTWPLVTALGSAVPNDLGDPVLNTWILWWNAFHWPLTEAWWNAGIFFPADHTLAFSEHLLGLAPLTTPITHLSGNPLVAYNVAFILTFALSATSSFLLALALTGRRDAAFVAGLAFGFAPYRIAQLSHLQVLAAFWMPLVLLGLHQFAATGRKRWLVLFASAFILQALTNGYYLMFMLVLVAVWLTWFTRRLGLARTGAVALATVTVVIAMSPVLLTYRSVHAHYGLERNLDQMRLYSADVAGWISASSGLLLWGGRLPEYGTAEGALFTGFTVLLLVGVGLLARNSTQSVRPALTSRSIALFYLIAAVVMFLLALGPAPSAFGERLGIPGPFSWLAGLPGFGSLRAPARFGMLMTLCATTGAAIGFARLTASWRAPTTAVALLVASVAVAAEGWPRAVSFWEPPKAWDLSATDGAGALLVLPILNELNEAASMYRAMSHGRPLVNGYSGHIPPWYLPLREALNDSDPMILETLARAGVSQVAVVNRNDRERAWRTFVLTHATFVRESADATFTLFNLNPPGPSLPEGQSIPIVAVHAAIHPEIVSTLTDGRPDTWWSTLAPQTGGEELIIDLGTLHQVQAVDLLIGRSGFEFPRSLEVDMSGDGAVWTRAWTGPTAGLAVGGLMRGAALGSINISFAPASARFVKLHQAARHRSAWWTVAELRVFQPAAGR